jgi:hypothetical protein
MKKYNYKGFQYADNLIAWLNKHQEIIVISIIYLERNLSYQVFYYTEENINGGYKGMG